MESGQRKSLKILIFIRVSLQTKQTFILLVHYPFITKTQKIQRAAIPLFSIVLYS